MYDKTLADQCTALAERKLSSIELCNLYLDRISQYDSELNSYITVCKEQAMAQAKTADEARNQGKATTMTGLPIALKDIFCTKDIKTSCGSKMLDNFISPYDATVTAKVKAAGMVILGKTNMDEFAMGSSNENSFYGPVHNPWDLTRVPGGSSGGSAAAIAAGLAPCATGTDTGGSIRQPAALCGITGIKPTYGRVSRYGMVAFASSLDQGGPMAKTAEDCALLLNVIAGFDEYDSTSSTQAVPDYTQQLNADISGLRIGIPKEYFGEGLAPEVLQTIHAALQEYERLGAKLIEINLPHAHLAVPAYYIVAPAECSSNLARFDGVRYGYRCENPQNLEDLYKRSRGEAFGAEVKRRIMIGTYALSAGYYDAYYLKAQKIRRLISQDFAAAFNKVDVIMGPTSPNIAFKLGEKVDDPLNMYLSDIYTIATNLAGLPGMSIPAGFINGMPVGLQIIGNYFNEDKLLNVAHRFQLATDWHSQMPQQFVS